MFEHLKIIIKSYLLWIKFHLSKSYRDKVERESNRRLKICEDCEHFNKSLRNCKLCGCFVDVKVLYYYELDENGISRDGCNAKKW